MPKIIISYRRADSQAMAGRIFDRLTARYGEESVFMDIDNIPFGTDFRAHIRDMLAQCNVLIAVIGPRWLGPQDGGPNRVHDPADPVRVEIEGALERKIPIVPVLIDGMRMPADADLPASLREFSFINAAPVDTGRDFRANIERLIRATDAILAANGTIQGALARTSPAAAPAPRPSRVWYAALAIVGLGAAGLLLATWPWTGKPSREPASDAKSGPAPGPGSEQASASTITLKTANRFLVPLLGKELKAANAGLDIVLDPSKPDIDTTWEALRSGRLDLGYFALEGASSKVPAFAATSMPGLVRNYEHARRVSDSGFIAQIKRTAAAQGVLVAADQWISRAVVSKKGCIRRPEDAKGIRITTTATHFESLWRAAGATIADITAGLSSDTVDAAEALTGSVLPLANLAQCVTVPGEYTLGFQYHPILVSKASFDRLNRDRQNALLKAARQTADGLNDGVKGLDDYLVRMLGTSGAQIVTLSKADYDAWIALAKASSYKEFAAAVPEGKKLIDDALAVK